MKPDTGSKWIFRDLDYRPAVDALVTALASLLSFCALHGIFPGALSVNRTFSFALAVAVVQAGVSLFSGTYGAFWRHFSVPDVVNLSRAVVIASVATTPLFLALGALPPLFFGFEFLLRASLLFSVRFFCVWNEARKAANQSRGRGRRTLIYGAGTAGRSLAAKFRADNRLRVNIVGFVDDDPEKLGRTFSDIKVIGNRATLAQILKTQEIEELIVVIRGIGGADLQEILQVAHQNKIRPRMLEEFDFLNSEQSRIKPFRDVELEDLLQRPKRSVELSSVEKLVRGKTVLVTGAGGSIGSELVRQLIKLDMKRLLVLDHSEFNLYQIDHELAETLGADKARAVPLLLDLKDKAGTLQAIKEYAPEVVFHAAAYKHVHLVEVNPIPAILNNVLGMRNILEISHELGVETFVLISSDKAVNPIGVMGATKRVCELLVTNMARKTGKTYCAVRFGNVLGSSGSLVPLLKRKIRNNEPINITHEEMTRYFMLIKEAVSLVLKAGSISSPGDINILRMGEPIRILDIARSLITMLGKTEREIPIVFVGLRPGEKMHEELYLCGNEKRTEHEDILVLPEGDSAFGSGMGAGEIEANVNQMIQEALAGSPAAVVSLRKLAAYAPRAKDSTVTEAA